MIRKRAFSIAIAMLFFASGCALANIDVDRRGGQIEGMLGATVCIPGRAPCQSTEGLESGEPSAIGGTQPSFGAGATLGWRPARWFMVGGAYRFGMFDPDYDRPYNVAYQHSGFLVLRPIVPVWRFDFGLDLGPGGSRQTFRMQNGDMDFSQGFAFLVGPTVNVFLTRHVYLGAKADVIVNGHRTTCRERSDRTSCQGGSADDRLAPVHQVLFGLTFGATFG